MPTYLCHGFRWYRTNIRPFVLLNNLEDASPDWLIGRTTSTLILKQFHKAFDFIPDPQILDAPENPGPPDHPRGPNDEDHPLPPPRVQPEEDKVLTHAWSAVKLLEEYDPQEMKEPSRPYAFVANVAVRVDLHADITDAIAKYGKLCAEMDTSWFPRLRDELQKGEHISWYVVVCGDEDRSSGGDHDHDELKEPADEPQVPERGRGPKGKEQATTSTLRHKPSRGEQLRRLFHRKTQSPGGEPRVEPY